MLRGNKIWKNKTKRWEDEGMERKFEKQISGTSICEERQKESWWGRNKQTRTVYKSLQKCKQLLSSPVFRNANKYYQYKPSEMQRSFVWYSKVFEWVFVIKYKATIIFHIKTNSIKMCLSLKYYCVFQFYRSNRLHFPNKVLNKHIVCPLNISPNLAKS